MLRVGDESSTNRLREPADLDEASAAAYHCSAGMEIITLDTGGLAGFARRGHWAVFPAEPISPAGLERATTAELLARMRAKRLKPVFAAARQVGAFRDLRLAGIVSANDAIVDLTTFSLDGPRRANLRHSCASAERGRIAVGIWNGEVDEAVRELSRSWLRTKRGGEWGFTLGRLDAWSPALGDGWVAVDERGRVVAIATWRSYAGGEGRVLDLMRRDPGAPNPAMDYLLVTCLRHYAAAGLRCASLAAVPVQRLHFAERIYPTESLHRYKDKFAPSWHPLWLVAPTVHDLPGAARAVLSAFCDGGLRKMTRPNDRG